jgi:hypothetical protein
MKILVFTDSRGVHRPSGSSHTMYPLRLAGMKEHSVTHYLCPYQWTTIPDFINLIENDERFNPANFDKIILHAGIVDHSPRPTSAAINRIYAPDDTTPSDKVEELFRTRNFSGNKIINRKQAILDLLFGTEVMKKHLHTPFPIEYEGEKTVNLYSLSMLEESLIPKLRKINNLIFISSNNFCRNWSGDYPKARPENISIIEDYSRLLCEKLDNVINLHQWTDQQVQRYTCDNLHLSADGNNWVYQRILEALGLKPRDYLNSKVSIGTPKTTTPWPLRARAAATDIASIEMKEPAREHVQSSAALKKLQKAGKPIATLIIGIRIKDDDSSRIENLQFLLAWIERFYPGLFDILIIEQDKRPTEDFRDIIPGSYRYEFLYNPEAYNRGWLYNVAVKHFTDLPVVAFCDTDILPGENFLDCIIDCHQDFDAISPNRNLYYSNPDEKAALFKTGSYADIPVTTESIKNPTTMAGGMLIVNREKFIDIGGFEQYVGYGCEDRALDVTMLGLLDAKRVRMDSYAYFHMHHPIINSERMYFNDIYAHMVENYGCEYFQDLTPLDYIHKNCSHASDKAVQQLAEVRKAHFGDPEMYRSHEYLTVNGLPPTLPGKLIQVERDEPVFPPSEPDFLDYVNKEEFIGKYAAGWAPMIRTGKTGPDTEDLAFFYNRFKGKRCFIIGNGPSLNKLDLSLLANEYTFAVNSFYYKTRETGFKPTFFVVEDSSVIKENVDEIVNYDAPFKFFPSIYRSLHPAQPGTYFFNINRGFYEKSSPNYAIPRFSTDITKVAYCGQSVTYINLQLAFFMGFTEVFLIGMDFSYIIPASHSRKGDVLTSDTDDPNHFHKDYFGKGKTWKDPKLDRVLLNYKMADFVYRCAGRRIYNATAGGNLEQFERVEYNGLFNGRDKQFSTEPLDLTRPNGSASAPARIIMPPAKKVDPQPSTPIAPGSITDAHRLFDAGEYAECVTMCDRLFDERKLVMYKNLATRARAKM